MLELYSNIILTSPSATDIMEINAKIFFVVFSRDMVYVFIKLVFILNF